MDSTAHLPRQPTGIDGDVRVLWITTSASWDGPGRALAALLQHWPSPDPMAIAVLRHAEPAFRRALPARVQLEEFGMSRLFDRRALGRIAAFMRAVGPDIVHTQLSRADWIGRFLARRQGIPVVSTIQNVHSRMYAAEFSWTKSRAALALDRLTSRSAARLLAVSTGVKHDLLRAGVTPSRVVVVPNAFDPSRESAPGQRERARLAFGCSDGEVVIGTVALLKAQKGVHDLIDAARIVTAEDARIRFVHVGGGPLESLVRSEIGRGPLADRFRLMGWVEDPLALLPGMDVFVLPSHWEGLPVALLEAMAASLPAIGTRVAGIEEVIVDRHTGRLVEARDPAALAAAILDLARAPDLCRTMGQAGRHRLDQFDARPVARATRQVYLDVLREARASTGGS